MDDGGPRILASAPTSRDPSGRTLRQVALLLVGVLVGVVIGIATGGGASAPPPAPGDPGPGQITADGAPQGFAHTPQGAVAAAGAYVDAVGAAEILSPERFAALTGAIATSQLAERMRSQAAAAQRSPGIRELQAATHDDGVFSQTVSLAYRVRSYTPREAVVELWTVSVLAGGRVDPQAAFSRSRETLVWSGGDWKWANAGKPIGGPTPGIERASATNSSRAFLRAVRGYRELPSGP
jgi:hypothetical protein